MSITQRSGFSQQEEGYSNLDCRLQDGAEEKLRQGRTYMQHAAWDFCGYVWFEEGLFHEEIWIYGGVITTISNPNLLDLIREVNDEYGSK